MTRSLRIKDDGVVESNRDGVGDPDNMEDVQDAVNEHTLMLDESAVDARLRVHMPPSLACLSPSQLERVDKEATRKLDILLMPTVVVLYILNYLDRQSIASAKLAGIEADLGLSAQQYSTAVAVLFVGYVGLQIPSNVLASKIKYPGTYICFMTAVWGFISACTGFTRGFKGLLLCRTLLGMAEAAFFPGVMFLVSSMYEKEKMALRTAIFYSGSQIGNAGGPVFALVILQQLDGVWKVEGWRWLFIVEGLFTILLALVFATYIPNSPRSMRWLTPVEKDQLVYRLEVDRGSKEVTKVGSYEAFMMSVSDPKTWFLCSILYCDFVAASVVNFFPVVVGGLGFSRNATLALSAPPYIICVFVILYHGWHSDKTGERTMHVAGPITVTLLGNIIALSTVKVIPRYFAMCILPSSFYATSTVVLSWISSSATGPPIKRAIVYAIINSICNTPNIWTSYLYNGGPRFILAFSVDLIASVGVLVATAATWLYLRRENERLDRGKGGKHGPSRVQMDAGFRYQL